MNIICGALSYGILHLGFKEDSGIMIWIFLLVYFWAIVLIFDFIYLFSYKVSVAVFKDFIVIENFTQACKIRWEDIILIRETGERDRSVFEIKFKKASVSFPIRIQQYDELKKIIIEKSGKELKRGLWGK